jgi:hypothetical protein
MRFHRIALTAASLAALAACKDNNVTTSDRPPLAGVRFINALTDTAAVDIKAVDQVEWSPVVNNLLFRAGTEQQPLEAKSRHLKVFAYNLTGGVPTLGGVSAVLLDTNVTLTANSRVTLLLTGSARAKTVKFVMINDDVAAPAAGQIAVRAVNASTGAVDVYYTATDTTTITGSPSVAGVASLAASPYVTRAAGTVAARVTATGSATAAASTAGPAAPTASAGTNPAAGVNSSGSAFSVYYFPRGVAGSPQNAVTTPTVTWFVDRVPGT